MNIIPGNAQDIGKREEQQDSFGFSDILDPEFVRHSGVIAVVADGMGGLEMGRESSQIAYKAVLECYMSKKPDESPPNVLMRAATLANKNVYRMAVNNGMTGNTGTTLVAAVIHGNVLYWISVGDSRIYLYRDGELTRLTHDHVYAQKLDLEVAQGRISREEAESHPERDSLTSYIGQPDLGEVDQNIRPFAVQQGDRILLCSDGLYDTLSEEEILADIKAGDAQTAAETLVARTLSKRSTYQDNVTVAIMACEGTGVSSGVVGGTTVRQKWSVFKKFSRLSLKILAVLVMLLIGFGVGILWNRMVNPVHQERKPAPEIIIHKADSDPVQSTTPPVEGKNSNDGKPDKENESETVKEKTNDKKAGAENVKKKASPAESPSPTKKNSKEVKTDKNESETVKEKTNDKKAGAENAKKNDSADESASPIRDAENKAVEKKAAKGAVYPAVE